jgi:hypothetical protein
MTKLVEDFRNVVYSGVNPLIELKTLPSEEEIDELANCFNEAKNSFEVIVYFSALQKGPRELALKIHTRIEKVVVNAAVGRGKFVDCPYYDAVVAATTLSSLHRADVKFNETDIGKEFIKYYNSSNKAIKTYVLKKIIKTNEDFPYHIKTPGIIGLFLDPATNKEFFATADNIKLK